MLRCCLLSRHPRGSQQRSGVLAECRNRGVGCHVLEHRKVYLVLVRGAAGSQPTVEDIVEGARGILARRVEEAQRRLGMPGSPRLPVAARAWTAFAEEAVTSRPLGEPDALAELETFTVSSFISLLGTLNRPTALPR
ncbi:hypothetical protein [Streptomyces sp. NPDC002785]|uniref:hypothetical protein n=1 Tax=Streptomyces sp. NPDC002785 TaxID=3154543 RepID=UPI00332E0F50